LAGLLGLAFHELKVRAAMRAFFDVLMTLKPQMIMVYVTSLVTASKERQTGAKSCKAGKVFDYVFEGRPRPLFICPHQQGD
jgi:hypothetical protein